MLKPFSPRDCLFLCIFPPTFLCSPSHHCGPSLCFSFVFTPSLIYFHSFFWAKRLETVRTQSKQIQHEYQDKTRGPTVCTRRTALFPSLLSQSNAVTEFPLVCGRKKFDSFAKFLKLIIWPLHSCGFIHHATPHHVKCTSLGSCQRTRKENTHTHPLRIRFIN